jgi:hypothetical protein
MAWTARSTWRRVDAGRLIEDLCEPQVENWFGYDVVPIPKDDTPDF